MGSSGINNVHGRRDRIVIPTGFLLKRDQVQIQQQVNHAIQLCPLPVIHLYLLSKNLRNRDLFSVHFQSNHPKKLQRKLKKLFALRDSVNIATVRIHPNGEEVLMEGNRCVMLAVYIFKGMYKESV